MDEFAHALTFFERSTAIYGQCTVIPRTMALCCEHLGQPARAKEIQASLQS